MIDRTENNIDQIKTPVHPSKEGWQKFVQSQPRFFLQKKLSSFQIENIYQTKDGFLLWENTQVPWATPNMLETLSFSLANAHRNIKLLFPEFKQTLIHASCEENNINSLLRYDGIKIIHNKNVLNFPKDDSTAKIHLEAAQAHELIHLAKDSLGHQDYDDESLPLFVEFLYPYAFYKLQPDFQNRELFNQLDQNKQSEDLHAESWNNAKRYLTRKLNISSDSTNKEISNLLGQTEPQKIIKIIKDFIIQPTGRLPEGIQLS